MYDTKINTCTEGLLVIIILAAKLNKTSKLHIALLIKVIHNWHDSTLGTKADEIKSTGIFQAEMIQKMSPSKFSVNSTSLQV